MNSGFADPSHLGNSDLYNDEIPVIYFLKTAQSNAESFNLNRFFISEAKVKFCCDTRTK